MHVTDAFAIAACVTELVTVPVTPPSSFNAGLSFVLTGPVTVTPVMVCVTYPVKAKVTVYADPFGTSVNA